MSEMYLILKILIKTNHQLKCFYFSLWEIHMSIKFCGNFTLTGLHYDDTYNKPKV